MYQAVDESKKMPWPSLHLIQTQWQSLVQGVFLAAVPIATISVLFFIPRYLEHYLGRPEAYDAFGSFVIFTLAAVSGLYISVISDRVGRLRLIRVGALLMIVLVPVSLLLLMDGRWPPALCLIPLLLSSSMVGGAYEASLVELFSTQNRYTGVALCHNLAACLFGGGTPALLEWLCSKGFLLSPGLWPSGLSILLLIMTFGWKDRYQTRLEAL